MEITQRLAESFVGGQVEIQNRNLGYLYRGGIAEATVEENSLNLSLLWLLKGEGFPPLPERWVPDSRNRHSVTLVGSSVSEAGDGRLAILSAQGDELVVLYKPRATQFDPKDV